jgi:hypothetical protein
MWDDSEKGLDSWYSLEVKKNKEFRNSQISEDQYKRLQIMEKVYNHAKVRYLPWFA